MQQIFFKTDKGNYREKNQDYIKLPDPEIHECEKLGYLFVICDGIGGYTNSEIASKYAAESLMENYYKLKEFPENPELYFKTLLRKIDSYLVEDNEIKRENKSTTIVFALVKDKKCRFFSVGDSRAYFFKNNELTQQTEDHSPVWQRYKFGLISKDEINDQPDKNILSAALGLPNFLKIFCKKIKLEQSDTILICSDGLTDYMKDFEICEILKKNNNLNSAGKKLIEAVIETGGYDNISIILIKQ